MASAATPIGAITLDTVAPREFTDAEVEFLVASASLVAGAIENAQLYDETRQRLSELEQLTELAEAVAAAETLDVLGPELVGARAAAARRRGGAPLPAATRTASGCSAAWRSRRGATSPRRSG